MYVEKMYFQDMKPLKQAADAFLEQKMCVSMLHKIATFMVANYRTLRKLTEDEKIEVYQAARQMCAEVSVQVPNHSNQETNPGPYKMAKFEDWAEEPPLLHDEVSRYLQEHCVNEGDILQWWKNNSQRLPRLACVARKILNIPATSASSERIFSCAGNLISEKRSRLNADRLNDLVIINSNINQQTH
ncbi:uncharacterized protein LOC126482176 [Schistocerca serialis cubense]|uniref:uncharacterized protein LOC126482176 n=1 Tax=Schistocerca serialis cubense TaxID=2023355 RepID=UPI00214E1EEF|nr:uncharacterized protein LOC126482176 [Schistocerca serialis cubense]